MSEDFLRASLAFFAVIDPIGNLLVFQLIASGRPPREAATIALSSVAIAFALLVLFAVAGERVLDLLAISPASFQIAAGLLLVLPAIRLVERGELLDASGVAGATSFEAAVAPLAVPMLSGPGALGIATAYGQRLGVGVTLAAAGLVLALTLVVFLVSAVPVLGARLHAATLRALARMVGVLLMAIAVDFVLSGWRAAFP